jgi:hypothetical protein
MPAGMLYKLRRRGTVTTSVSANREDCPKPPDKCPSEAAATALASATASAAASASVVVGEGGKMVVTRNYTHTYTPKKEEGRN